MQETGFPKISMPPPPPPPPPATSHLTSVERSYPPEEDAPYMYFRRVFQNCESGLISFYKPLSSVIQEGPSCGIAALCMASQFFGSEVTLEQVRDKAIASGFSKQGEMFSAYNMANLANSVLACKALVVDDLFLNQTDVLHHLCSGLPVLVPYDADKNHYPCLNNGAKAHWAVLSGVCVSVPETDLQSSGGHFESCDIPFLYKCQNGEDVKKVLHLANKICVYAYHGKSRYNSMWAYDDLLASSENMKEVTKKYSMENMVLPMPEPLSELRNKAVLLG